MLTLLTRASSISHIGLPVRLEVEHELYKKIRTGACVANVLVVNQLVVVCGGERVEVLVFGSCVLAVV